MKEIDIIKHAKNYMEMLSCGVNPITKAPYDEKSDINNERLLKCFSYVAEILDRVAKEEEAKEKRLNSNKQVNIPNGTANVNETPYGTASVQNKSVATDLNKAGTTTNNPAYNTDDGANNDTEYTKYDISIDTPVVPNSIVPDEIMGREVVDILLKKGVIKQGTKK